MSEPRIIAKIAADARRVAREEGRGLSPLMVLRLVLLTPGFQFVLMIRLQEMAARLPLIGAGLALVLWWFASTIFRCDLGRECRVGAGLYVPHPYGIVLSHCVLGDNVALLQNVTASGAGEGQHRLRVDDGAYLGAGCVIDGAFIVGQGALVGANAVVTGDVPAYSIVVGNPAHIVSQRRSGQ